jgi:hypothetical protein
MKKFRARMEDPGGGGAFVTIPFDVEKEFGRKRVPINATIDGEPYRGTLVRMGSECHMLLILKSIREKIGKSIGDEVDVTIAEDTAPRIVELAGDVRAALDKSRKARAFYDGLSYTHQREYAQWVDSAKRPDTRTRRIEQMVQMLIEGKRGK